MLYNIRFYPDPSSHLLVIYIRTTYTCYYLISMYILAVNARTHTPHGLPCYCVYLPFMITHPIHKALYIYFKPRCNYTTHTTFTHCLSYHYQLYRPIIHAHASSNELPHLHLHPLAYWGRMVTQFVERWTLTPRTGVRVPETTSFMYKLYPASTQSWS